MLHHCDFCQRPFDTATQPSFGARESKLRRRIRELQGKTKDELMSAYIDIFEKKRIPKHLELLEYTGKNCADCEDDSSVLVAITGLLHIDAARRNPLNPQGAIGALLKEISQKLPYHTYELH